jgi:hypothetical protein
LRRAILGIVLSLAGAACSATSPGSGHGPTVNQIRLERSPTPYSEVSAGPVHALVPDGWHPIAPTSFAGEGFFASPSPRAWSRMDGTTEGIAATWVDETEIGVPSDFYYLAATGPLFSRLLDSPDCRAQSQEVYLNHRPSFAAAGKQGSPGDYMARGAGTCHARGHMTRWAYFVAAPGFGPVRAMGIPRSGLYVVVAVLRNGNEAGRVLQRLIDQTSFGDAAIRDFVRVARGRPLAAAA